MNMVTPFGHPSLQEDGLQSLPVASGMDTAK